MNPGLPEARSAAAGAGDRHHPLQSGSTVLSFAFAAQACAVAAALRRSYQERGVPAEVHVLGCDNEGLREE
jgi:hypothetical protein